MCFVSIGYVLRVQAGGAPMGINNAGDYKGLSELPIFRIPTAGYKTSSVDRGQSANIYPAQEDHTINSQSHYPYPAIPETQNVPKSQANYFKSGFSSASLAGGRSTVVYNPSGNKAFTFPDGVHQASSDSVFSTGAVQLPPRSYHARTRPTGGFSPVQIDKATLGFGQSNRKAVIYAHSSTASPHIQDIKSESQKIFMKPPRPNVHPLHPQESSLSTRPTVIGYHPAYVFPNRFNHDGSNWLQKGLKPMDERTDTVSPGSTSAEKVDTRMSYPTWSPRGYSSDVTSEARGYAHVRHLKPGFDKTRHDSGLVVPASSERRPNLNYNSRGKQPGSWHPLQQDRAQTLVQGKFKPFQRVSNDELPVHNRSEGETAPTQPSTETTIPPSLNSTGIASSVVPSVNEELSTESASLMQTEGLDAELVPQASNREGQSESSAEVGPSSEQNEPLTVSPPPPQPAETEG